MSVESGNMPTAKIHKTRSTGAAVRKTPASVLQGVVSRTTPDSQTKKLPPLRFRTKGAGKKV